MPNEATFYHFRVHPFLISPCIFFWPFQFGGGRVIRPGEVLETEEEKAAKEARTKQLLAAYKKKIGLNIDPKLKSECEEVSISGGISNIAAFLPIF